MDSLDDLPRYLRKKPRRPWEMIYDPDEFEEAHKELSMEEWRLSDVELREQAVICSAT
jgi:hypothetical protein